MELPLARFAARASMPAVILVLALLLYGVGLFRPFMAHDFEAVVLPRLGSAAEPQFSVGPLVELSFAAGVGLTGLEPMPLRLVNVLLLAGAGVALAYWIIGYTQHRALAWCAAAIFVAHPVHVQLVMDLVGRAGLMTVLGLALFGGLQQRALVQGGWTTWRSVGAALAALLAMGSSDSGLLALPLAILQAGQAPRLHIPISDAGRHQRPLYRSSVLIVLAALVVHVALRTTVTDWPTPPAAVGAHDLTGNPLAEQPISERAPAALALAWFYPVQLVWTNFEFNQVPASLATWSSVQTWLGVVVLLAAVLGLLVSLRRHRWAAVGWMLGLGHYLVAGNLLFVSEHYATNLNTPLFTASALLVVSAWLSRRMMLSARKAAQVVIPTLLLLVPLSYKSLGNADKRWMSDLMLTRLDIAAQPDNPVALYHHAEALNAAGLHSRAASMLDRVVSERPTSIQALYKQAEVRAAMGDLAGVEESYRRVLELRPQDLRARCKLAELALSRDDLAGAEEHIAAAESAAPQSPGVMLCRARLLAEQNQRDQALQVVQQVLAAHPEHAGARRLHDELSSHD